MRKKSGGYSDSFIVREKFCAHRGCTGAGSVPARLRSGLVKVTEHTIMGHSGRYRRLENYWWCLDCGNFEGENLIGGSWLWCMDYDLLLIVEASALYHIRA